MLTSIPNTLPRWLSLSLSLTPVPEEQQYISGGGLNSELVEFELFEGEWFSVLVSTSWRPPSFDQIEGNGQISMEGNGEISQ